LIQADNACFSRFRQARATRQRGPALHRCADCLECQPPCSWGPRSRCRPSTQSCLPTRWPTSGAVCVSSTTTLTSSTPPGGSCRSTQNRYTPHQKLQCKANATSAVILCHSSPWGPRQVCLFWMSIAKHACPCEFAHPVWCPKFSRSMSHSGESKVKCAA